MQLNNNYNWFFLSLYEIKLRYRYSSFGPFWITISNFLLIFVLGFVYSTIFKHEFNKFFINLGYGIIIWNYFSTLILSNNLLIEERNIFLNYNLDLDFLIKKSIFTQFLIFLHNFPILAGFIIYFKINLSFFLIANFIIAIILINILAYFYIKFIAIVSIKFRDVTPIIQNLLQIFFFSSPIIWSEEMIVETKFSFLLIINPFYYLLKIMRDPLQGLQPNINNYYVTILLILIMIFISQNYYNKIKYVFKTWY